MNMNLSNGYFDGSDFGYANQNAPNIMETSSRAVLYVFKPHERQFGDVGLRPLQYHFDENFSSELQHVTDLAKRGTAQSAALIRNLMDTNNLNEYMIPASNVALQMHTSQLSDRYRFILILTEKAKDLLHGGTIVGGNSNSQMRRIYTGFFEDEPFNMSSGFGGNRTLNERAMMYITHKTVVGTSIEHGRFGASTSINTRASEEIIHPQLTQALISRNGASNPDLFIMTPKHCLNTFDVSDEGVSLAIPGASSMIGGDTGASVVQDVLERPDQNVSHIVRGLIQFQDDISHRSRLNTNRMASYFEDEFLDNANARGKAARYLDLPRYSQNGNPFDLDVDRRYSADDIDKMVNHNLDVIDFDQPRPQFYETADQMEASMTNMYSSLIADVVGPILSSAGLNAMQFEYEIARIRGQVTPNFIIHSAEPTFTSPTSDIISMAKAVEIELRNGIFQTIFLSKGDFHVAVSANVTGMTIIRLSLVAQGFRNQVDFEIPTCLGGLISPLIGDAATNANNSEQVETLYNVATGMSNPRGLDSDSEAFADFGANKWQELIGSSVDSFGNTTADLSLNID